MVNYPGGKNGAGTYQKLINLIPPHSTYIETHLGSGAILRNKKPANWNIGIDLYQYVLDSFIDEQKANPSLYRFDALNYIRINHVLFDKNTFVYCDPPYLLETRRGDRAIYKYEYKEQDHINLLLKLRTLKSMVMVSGYNSELYNKYLYDWNVTSFPSMTRGGLAEEFVWMNYPTPVELHDYRYLGNDYRERERISKKKKRWVARLQRMPLLEKQALLSAIEESKTSE